MKHRTALVRPSPAFVPDDILCASTVEHCIVVTLVFPIHEPHLFAAWCGICHCLQQWSMHIEVQFTSSKIIFPS